MSTVQDDNVQRSRSSLRVRGDQESADDGALPRLRSQDPQSAGTDTEEAEPVVRRRKSTAPLVWLFGVFLLAGCSGDPSDEALRMSHEEAALRVEAAVAACGGEVGVRRPSEACLVDSPAFVECRTWALDELAVCMEASCSWDICQFELTQNMRSCDAEIPLSCMQRGQR